MYITQADAAIKQKPTYRLDLAKIKLEYRFGFHNLISMAGRGIRGSLTRACLGRDRPCIVCDPPFSSIRLDLVPTLIFTGKVNGLGTQDLILSGLYLDELLTKAIGFLHQRNNRIGYCHKAIRRYSRSCWRIAWISCYR